MALQKDGGTRAWLCVAVGEEIILISKWIGQLIVSVLKLPALLCGVVNNWISTPLSVFYPWLSSIS